MQNLISLLIGLSTFITISGFFVLQAHLSRYTDLLRFSLHPVYYLMAGFSLLIALAVLILAAWFGTKLGDGWIWTGQRIINNISWLKRLLWVIPFILMGIYMLWGLLKLETLIIISLIFLNWLLFALFFIFSGLAEDERQNGQIEELLSLLVEPKRVVSRMINKPFSIVSVYVFLLLALYIPLISSVYGTIIYSRIPGAFGGGQPVTGHIVFNNSDLLSELGLSTVNNLQTDTICILVELDQSFIVYDPQQFVVTSLKKDDIDAIIDTHQEVDCAPPAPISQSTPQAISTPMLSPTPTP